MSSVPSAPYYDHKINPDTINVVLEHQIPRSASLRHSHGNIEKFRYSVTDDNRDYPTDDQMNIELGNNRLSVRSADRVRNSKKHRQRVKSETSGIVGTSYKYEQERELSPSIVPYYGNQQRYYSTGPEIRTSVWEPKNYQRISASAHPQPVPPTEPPLTAVSPRHIKTRNESPYGDLESDHSSSDPPVAVRQSRPKERKSKSTAFQAPLPIQVPHLFDEGFYLNEIEPIPSEVVNEKERVSIIEQLGIIGSTNQGRFDKMIQITAQLVQKPICAFTIVAEDKVFYKSYHGKGQNPIEEPRYQSFSSWVVQDVNGRGIVIQDSNTDPRCSHMKKEVAECYVGIPVVFQNKYRIGTLCFQGPANIPFTILEINILNEMSKLISLECDYIWSCKSIKVSQTIIDAQLDLRDQLEDSKKDSRILEKSLTLMNKTFKASCTMLLKISADVMGPQCRLQAYSTVAPFAKFANLSIGKDIFRGLCMQTLNREQRIVPFVYHSHPGETKSELEDQFSKAVPLCLSESLYNSCGPCAVIISCFEQTKAFTNDELVGYTKLIQTISRVLDQSEKRESLISSQKLQKEIMNSFKNSDVEVLYPVVVAIQPTILSHQLEAEKTLTKQNLEMDTSISCFETLNDLNQIMNATAETVEMKRPKKHGHHYCITF